MKSKDVKPGIRVRLSRSYFKRRMFETSLLEVLLGEGIISRVFAGGSLATVSFYVYGSKSIRLTNITVASRKLIPYVYTELNKE